MEESQKPFMMCLGPELLAHRVFTGPRICKGWGASTPGFPFCQLAFTADLAVLENITSDPLECFSSIFKMG